MFVDGRSAAELGWTRELKPSPGLPVLAVSLSALLCAQGEVMMGLCCGSGAGAKVVVVVLAAAVLMLVLVTALVLALVLGSALALGSKLMLVVYSCRPLRVCRRTRASRGEGPETGARQQRPSSFPQHRYTRW